MPQPKEVKSQSEQQSLPRLHEQVATWRFGRELAFDHREHGFYFGARSIHLQRKSAVHLIAEFSFRNAPLRDGRDHAVGSQRAAHVSVIGFGVELRVHQAGQSPCVAPQTLSRSLRQNDLAIHIDHDQPLQKVSVARLPALLLLDAAHEIGADGVLRARYRQPPRKPRVGRGAVAVPILPTLSMVSSGSRRKKRYTVV
jgi:hypothetical protein